MKSQAHASRRAHARSDFSLWPGWSPQSVTPNNHSTYLLSLNKQLYYHLMFGVAAESSIVLPGCPDGKGGLKSPYYRWFTVLLIAPYDMTSLLLCNFLVPDFLLFLVGGCVVLSCCLLHIVQFAALLYCSFGLFHWPCRIFASVKWFKIFKNLLLFVTCLEISCKSCERWCKKPIKCRLHLNVMMNMKAYRTRELAIPVMCLKARLLKDHSCFTNRRHKREHFCRSEHVGKWISNHLLLYIQSLTNPQMYSIPWLSHDCIWTRRNITVVQVRGIVPQRKSLPAQPTQLCLLPAKNNGSVEVEGHVQLSLCVWSPNFIIQGSVTKNSTRAAI